MTKLLSAVLIMTMILTFSFAVNSPVQAESSLMTAEVKDKLITVAKGALAMFLINKLNDLVNTRDKVSQPPAVQQPDNLEKPLPIVDDPAELNGKIIVIDPGHGGSDPGAVGPGGLREKDLNLNIALKLYQELKDRTTARVYLTRDVDKFIPLEERGALANRLGADLFISIHSNAEESGREDGIETYAHYKTASSSWALAWYIHESLVKTLNFADRGLKAENFQVIRDTASIDSVLLEIGFISNSQQEAVLRKTSTQQKAAEAIYQGIINYYAEK